MLIYLVEGGPVLVEVRDRHLRGAVLDHLPPVLLLDVLVRVRHELRLEVPDLFFRFHWWGFTFNGCIRGDTDKTHRMKGRQPVESR